MFRGQPTRRLGVASPDRLEQRRVLVDYQANGPRPVRDGAVEPLRQLEKGGRQQHQQGVAGRLGQQEMEA